jgi:PTH2 family peptidyl-tRNA hydrolase
MAFRLRKVRLSGDQEIKQAIVVRTDIKMGKGKLVAQASHASLMSYLNCKNKEEAIARDWISTGEKKVVLKVNGETELVALRRLCERERIPCALVVDAGLTQIEPGTSTALGIGPWYGEEINKISGDLKLL